MTTLIIARHGNTFEDHEQPRMVGGRTDLPLVTKGRLQARALADDLKNKNLVPDIIFTSLLKRTVEMGKIIKSSLDLDQKPVSLKIFNEIDYGPDENKFEDDVRIRIGEEAFEKWRSLSIVPPGWSPNEEQIKFNWKNFSKDILNQHQNKKILVLTSNGIARFALNLTGYFEQIIKDRSVKLATGAYGILEYPETGPSWILKDWNIRPSLEATLGKDD